MKDGYIFMGSHEITRFVRGKPPEPLKPLDQEKKKTPGERACCPVDRLQKMRKNYCGSWMMLRSKH